MRTWFVDPKRDIRFAVAAILAAAIFACFAAWPELRLVWLLLLVALTALYLWFFRRRQSEGLTDAIAPRLDLSDAEIVSEYFSDLEPQRVKVLELLQEIATCFGVPAGKLRPSDRFGYELLGGDGVDDDAVDLQIAMGIRAKSLGLKVMLQQVPTVDAYVRCFALLSASR